MQIRLTVTLGPRGSGQGAGGSVGAPGTAPSCDVLVTAPSGTPLSAVTGALVSTAASAAGAGAGGAQGGADSPASITPSPSTADSSAAVYVGTERLDPHRQMLGEPPLLDGAVVSLHGPVPAASTPALAAYGSAKARLHVIAGPDAGGIHLLQGGKVHLGRSAETDVPLDDPDVSRLHCAVTVSDGGAVTVTDLDSTNGTWLDGVPVGRQPVLFRPGSTLRVGESALRVEVPSPEEALASPGAVATGASGAGHPVPGSPADAVRAAVPESLPTVPDGNGQLRLAVSSSGAPTADARGEQGPAAGQAHPASAPPAPTDGAHGYAGGPFTDDPHGPHGIEAATTHGAGFAQHLRHSGPVDGQFEAGQLDGQQQARPRTSPPGAPHPGVPGASAAGEPVRSRSRGPIAWARRITGARPGEGAAASAQPGARPDAVAARGDERRPDPAAILLTALGPGPRLWEREPGHPDAHDGADRHGPPQRRPSGRAGHRRPPRGRARSGSRGRGPG